jgi:hypothetical protein
MSEAARYEPGMRIDYNAHAKTVTVTFRGRVKNLNGIFATADAARAAGESYCRLMGWRPESPVVAVKSLLAHRRASSFF